MKARRFKDEWRGDGFFLAGRHWLIAVRWRWHFYYSQPPMKPGYRRLYIGPFEIEIRP